MVTNIVIVALLTAGLLSALGLMAIVASDTRTGHQVRQTLFEWAASDPSW